MWWSTLILCSQVRIPDRIPPCRHTRSDLCRPRTNCAIAGGGDRLVPEHDALKQAHVRIWADHCTERIQKSYSALMSQEAAKQKVRSLLDAGVRRRWRDCKKHPSCIATEHNLR